MTELNKPTLNQVSSLITALRRTSIIDKHLNLSDYKYIWDCLRKITFNQYQEILRLLNINQVKLVKFLISIGLKEKI